MATVLRIKKRADFVKVKNSGNSIATAGLVLQSMDRKDGDSTIRIGFTATGRIGNAVKRNFVKRRLRSLAGQVMGSLATPGFDYVIIGRFSTDKRDFSALLKDLKYALHKTRETDK